MQFPPSPSNQVLPRGLLITPLPNVTSFAGFSEGHSCRRVSASQGTPQQVTLARKARERGLTCCVCLGCDGAQMDGQQPHNTPAGLSIDEVLSSSAAQTEQLAQVANATRVRIAALEQALDCIAARRSIGSDHPLPNVVELDEAEFPIDGDSDGLECDTAGPPPSRTESSRSVRLLPCGSACTDAC